MNAIKTFSPKKSNSRNTHRQFTETQKQAGTELGQAQLKVPAVCHLLPKASKDILRHPKFLLDYFKLYLYLRLSQFQLDRTWTGLELSFAIFWTSLQYQLDCSPAPTCQLAKQNSNPT